jgi:hypothetical protein
MFRNSKRIVCAFSYTIALFCVTWAIYQFYPVTSSLETYQERWAPALSVACFGRIALLDFSKLPAEEAAAAEAKVNAFLNRRPVRKFDCASLPEGTTTSPMSGESDHMRFFHRYQVGLMASVGALWAIFGPDWALVGVFSALLAAATLMMLFSIANSFTGVVPAAAITAFVGTNSFFLFMIPITRDFAKAFFIVGSFFFILRIAMHRFDRYWHYLLACAAFGLFLGFGLGFRQDVVAAGALCGLLLVLFPPEFAPPRRSAPAVQAAALLLFAAGFLLFMIPLYRLVPVNHGIEGHFLILGLFNGAFRYAQFPLGDFIFNPSYEDFSGYGLIGAYAMAETGEPTILTYSPEYNILSVRQFVEFASVFPFVVIGRIYTILADILASASYLASSNSVVGSPLGSRGGLVLLSVNSIVALYAAFRRSRRLFFFLTAYLLASSAILSIQYMERHFFHMHLLWFALATSLSVGLLASKIPGIGRMPALWAWVAKDPQNPPPSSMRFIKSLVAVSAILPAVAFLAQQITRERWIGVVEASRYDAASYSAVPSTDGSHRVLAKLGTDGTFPSFSGASETYESASQRKSNAVVGGYLRARFKSIAECGHTSNAQLRIVYESKFSYFNLTHQAVIRSGKPLDHFVPVFFMADSRFSGIEMPETLLPCLESLSWSKDFRKIRLPVEFSKWVTD